MIDFLKENWRILLDVILVVCSIVVFIIKKRPIKITDSVQTVIIQALPGIINRVEKYKDPFDPLRKLSGDEKLKMALSICQSLLVDDLGLKESELPLYTSWIVEQIETILSTPQKKGDSDEKRI